VQKGIARGWGTVRKADWLCTPQEQLPSNESFTGAFDLKGIPVQGSRYGGGREEFAFNRSRVYNLPLGFRQLTSLMLKHALHSVGNDFGNLLRIHASGPHKLIQHAYDEKWIAATSPMQRSNQSIVRIRFRETARNVVADVGLCQVAQWQNAALRVDLEFSLNLTERMAYAS
jgi:hypothetical protein